LVGFRFHFSLSMLIKAAFIAGFLRYLFLVVLFLV